MDVVWFGLLVVGVAVLGMLAGGGRSREDIRARPALGRRLRAREPTHEPHGRHRDAPVPLLRRQRARAGRAVPWLRRVALTAVLHALGRASCVANVGSALARRRLREEGARRAATAYRIHRQMRFARLLILAGVVVAACGRTGNDGTLVTPAATSTGPAAVGPPAASTTRTAAPTGTPDVAAVKLVEFPVGAGQGPHDVAPAPDGGVWYTAQRTGELGYFDPKTGATRMVKLGSGSAPHGVIVGPDGAPWVTDGGLNAIVRVDPASKEVRAFKLPGPNVNLNTAAFDRFGILWFTGQSGFFGHVDPKSGAVRVLQSPRGVGPYGITSTPDGAIFYASLANSHIAAVDLKEDVATPIDPPTRGQGARRVWSDSKGVIWLSEWNAGQVGRYAHRLRRERDRSIRPTHRDVHVISARAAQRRGPPTAGTSRRGLGRDVGSGQAGADQDALAAVPNRREPESMRRSAPVGARGFP